MRKLLLTAGTALLVAGASAAPALATTSSGSHHATASVAQAAPAAHTSPKTCPSPAPNGGKQPPCGIDHNPIPQPGCSHAPSGKNPNCPSPSPSQSPSQSPSPTPTPAPCGFGNPPTGPISGILGQVATGVGENPLTDLVMQIACGLQGAGL